MRKRERPALVALERREAVAGWVYLPVYLLLLSIILTYVFHWLGFDLNSEAMQLHLNVVYGLVNFVVVWLIFRRYLIKSFDNVKKFPLRFVIAVLAGFAVYYFGSWVTEVLAESLTPGFENVNDESLGAMGAYGMWELALYAAVLVPVAEECLFRGLIFTSLRPKSRFLAYAVTIAFFSFIHVMGYFRLYPPMTLLLCFLQYVPASFGLAWALEYSGSIWAPVTIHTLANTMALIGVALGQ